MATWAEFEQASPDFAHRVHSRLTAGRHLTMATLRRDGSPRISGTEIDLAKGRLQIGSMPGAVKARDLQRDPRIAIHGPTTDPPEGRPADWPGEAKVAGTATELGRGGESHTFQIDIREVVLTSLNAAGDRLLIESWTPERGYQRRERS